DDLEDYNGHQIDGAEALLFGRTTYQIWAAFWPTMTGNDEMKVRLEAMPKYVVSNSVARSDWPNSIFVTGDVAGRVRAIKAEGDGAILCYGSADLLAELMRNDLVDEYRILLFPVVLGAGKHLFRDGIETKNLELVSSRAFDSGTVLLVYRPLA